MPPPAPSTPSAYPRVDPRAGDGVGLANRLGGTDRLCETLSSWRLLVGGRSPAASHHSFTTSSEEPPLSNFNNQWDIPRSGLGKERDSAAAPGVANDRPGPASPHCRARLCASDRDRGHS